MGAGQTQYLPLNSKKKKKDPETCRPYNLTVKVKKTEKITEQ